AVSAFSPAYAAPEQWSPKRLGQTGPWTDVWGLGLCLVEAMKGDDALTGEQAEMMSAALDPEHRPTPRSQGVLVSDAVERVFTRALAVDPRSRYGSIAEFWDDLVLSVGLQRELGSLGARSSNKKMPIERDLDLAMPEVSRVSADEPTPLVSRTAPVRPVSI